MKDSFNVLRKLCRRESRWRFFANTSGKKVFLLRRKKRNMNVEIQESRERSMFFPCMCEEKTDILYQILKTLKYSTENAILHFRDRYTRERRIFLEARRVRPLPLTRGSNCGCFCSCISFARLSLCVWPCFGIST